MLFFATMMSVAGFIASILAFYLFLKNRELKQENKKAWELAEHDPLTGLLNKLGLESRLKPILSVIQAKSVGGSEEHRVHPHVYDVDCLTIVFIDINGLKDINDRFGHKAGDELILAAAELFTEQIRDSDLVARIGGDEMIIAFPDHDPGFVGDKMEQILQLFSEHQFSFDQQYSASFSYGQANTTERKSLAGLIKLADEKMYEEKRRMMAPR